METIDLLLANELTSAKLLPPERRVLFADNIADVSLENIERISQQHCELHQRNTETTTGTGDQVHGTTVDLSAYQKKPPTRPNVFRPLPTNSNQCRS